MKCNMLYHDTCLCEIELDICPYSCFVRHVLPLPGKGSYLKEIVPEDYQQTEDSVCNYLTGFLSARIPKYMMELSDNEILEKLNLSHHAHQFGRMQSYLFILAFLEHLNMEDGIMIYPKEVEYLYFVDQDPRFDRVYRVVNK